MTLLPLLQQPLICINLHKRSQDDWYPTHGESLCKEAALGASQQREDGSTKPTENQKHEESISTLPSPCSEEEKE